MPDQAPPASVLGPLSLDGARWLGQQAARRRCVEAGEGLIRPYGPAMLAAYREGALLPAGCSARPDMAEARRRGLIRELERAAWPTPVVQAKREAPVLPATIAALVQRADVGTATRYDVTLCREDVKVTLHDLRAPDLLSWSRLRPIAFDARLILPALGKGQGDLWLSELSRAMAEATRCALDGEDSEAMELRGILHDLTSAARLWTWCEEDPHPRGIARVEHDGNAGWPRGPLLREVRAQLGHVSRVALRRARVDLGLLPREWRIETAYLRVWARPLAEVLA